MSEIDRFRAGRAYTIRDAARYAGTSPATVRRWIVGYDHRDRHMDPVFADKTTDGTDAVLLSFLDLAEIAVASQFTRHGGQLEKVRAARRRALNDFPELEYPFASLRLKQIGGEILHAIDEEYGGRALALSLGGLEGEQYVLPGFVEHALDLFDFDPLDTMATRWFPAGRDVPVVVDPRIAGGRLTVLDRGVTVDAIHRRFFSARQDIDFIARDYELEPRTVEKVIAYARVGS